MESLQSSLGYGAAGEVITILVDEIDKPEFKTKEEDYYVTIGNCVYKIIADNDVRSMMTFECPQCKLIFGIRPGEIKDKEIIGSLCCPRCRRSIAMLESVK